MPIFLILFDGKGEKEAIARLGGAVEEYGDSLALSDESYLITTERNSEDVFDTIKRKLGVDDNESLMVLTVPQPYMGRAPSRVKLWLSRQNEKYLETGPSDPGVLVAD